MDWTPESSLDGSFVDENDAMNSPRASDLHGFDSNASFDLEATQSSRSIRIQRYWHIDLTDPSFGNGPRDGRDIGTSKNDDKRSSKKSHGEDRQGGCDERRTHHAASHRSRVSERKEERSENVRNVGTSRNVDGRSSRKSHGEDRQRGFDEERTHRHRSKGEERSENDRNIGTSKNDSKRSSKKSHGEDRRGECDERRTHQAASHRSKGEERSENDRNIGTLKNDDRRSSRKSHGEDGVGEKRTHRHRSRSPVRKEERSENIRNVGTSKEVDDGRSSRKSHGEDRHGGFDEKRTHHASNHRSKGSRGQAERSERVGTSKNVDGHSSKKSHGEHSHGGVDERRAHHPSSHRSKGSGRKEERSENDRNIGTSKNGEGRSSRKSHGEDGGPKCEEDRRRLNTSEDSGRGPSPPKPVRRTAGQVSWDLIIERRKAEQRRAGLVPDEHPEDDLDFVRSALLFDETIDSGGMDRFEQNEDQTAQQESNEVVPDSRRGSEPVDEHDEGLSQNMDAGRGVEPLDELDEGVGVTSDFDGRQNDSLDDGSEDSRDEHRCRARDDDGLGEDKGSSDSNNPQDINNWFKSRPFGDTARDEQTSYGRDDDEVDGAKGSPDLNNSNGDDTRFGRPFGDAANYELSYGSRDDAGLGGDNGRHDEPSFYPKPRQETRNENNTGTRNDHGFGGHRGSHGEFPTTEGLNGERGVGVDQSTQTSGEFGNANNENNEFNGSNGLGGGRGSSTLNGSRGGFSSGSRGLNGARGLSGLDGSHFGSRDYSGRGPRRTNPTRPSTHEDDVFGNGFSDFDHGLGPTRRSRPDVRSFGGFGHRRTNSARPSTRESNVFGNGFTDSYRGRGSTRPSEPNGRSSRVFGYRSSSNNGTRGSNAFNGRGGFDGRNRDPSGHRSRHNEPSFNPPQASEPACEPLALKKGPPKCSKCRNCHSTSHPTSFCTIEQCWKCRAPVDWMDPQSIHPNQCIDALKGFMGIKFEMEKNKFYSERKFQSYQELPIEQMSKFYDALAQLCPGNEHGFCYRFADIVASNKDFGNLGGRSLIVAHNLLWKKLLVTEAFELDLPDLQVHWSNCQIQGAGETFTPLALTFSINDYSHLPTEIRVNQSYLKRKLKHNGVYGFPIYICFPNEGLEDQVGDENWPMNIPRRLISKTRVSATVYQCSPLNRNGFRLLIDPIRELRGYAGQGYMPSGQVLLAFNHHSKRMKEETQKMRDFIDNHVDTPTFPRHLGSMLRNFYIPIMPVFQSLEYMGQCRLEMFNHQLPHPYKLLPEQLNCAFQAYENELHGILGPAGSGKTTILCFLAIYNWFIERKRTLLLSTRRDAAKEITLRLVRMSKHVLGLSQFRKMANGQQYIWYKMEKDSLMEPRDPEIEAVSSFEHHVPEQVTMLVGILNFLTSDVVIQFKSDHVLLDDVSSVCTTNFYALLIMLNEKNSNLPQNFTVFGDQFQLNARFSKENFLSDGIETASGFDESALVQLLKCKLPFSQMNNIMRSSKPLVKIIQPFYDYRLSTDQCPPQRPLLLDFSGCFNIIKDLADLPKRHFISLFINLPSKDTNGNHFCDADDQLDRKRNGNQLGGHDDRRREGSGDRRLDLANRRNIFYASQILQAILTNNEDISSKDCLYVTPYRVQESEFYHRPNKTGSARHVRGQTIDRAIATEAGFVLVDLVRTGSIGFMNGQPEQWPTYDSAKRLLVALSRASRAQIILGSVDLARISNQPANPIDKLAAYHLNSRDPMVALVDLPPSSVSIKYFLS